MKRFAVGKPGMLFRRLAPAIVAAYLLHWGVLDLLFVVDQVVLSALTKTVSWLALAIFHNFSFVEVGVAWRYLLPQIAIGVVPLILGLLVGWWVWRRRRKTQQQSLQPSESK